MSAPRTPTPNPQSLNFSGVGANLGRSERRQPPCRNAPHRIRTPSKRSLLSATLLCSLQYLYALVYYTHTMYSLVYYQYLYALEYYTHTTYSLVYYTRMMCAGRGRNLEEVLNPQPSTLNPQPPTLNPQPSTLYGRTSGE